MECYNKNEKELFSLLNTTPNGISISEAKKRLQKNGLNELKEKKGISPIKIFFNQFKSFIVLILAAAIIISLLINEPIDAIVIAIILIINAILGFLQEYKAEKSIEALKKFIALKSKVIRDGKEIIILAKEIVLGDIIILEEGFKVPSDARILESYSLSIDESTLTGESTPIKKISDILIGKKQVADQKNMVFSSTLVTSGKGKAVVTATGTNTEIGKIAILIQETKKELTPLQKQLATLSKHLGLITIAICIITFFAIFLKTGIIADSLIFGVALAVAAIPEGLPAIVTIGLALGTQRMIKHNVLIRKLPSVETLGCTTVICADKTGTLTLNKMTVASIYINNKIINTEKAIKKDNNIELLLNIGVLCNNARTDNKSGIGDPTELALLNIAKKIGITREKLQTLYKRVYELPFSSERKMMSTVNINGKKKFMFTKGAPDVILKSCNRIYLNNKLMPLTNKLKSDILKANEELAGNALRVLGFAYKESTNYDENNLIFVGLQGMIDPPRNEVKKSIEQCKTAGIKVVMITGDHKLTAEAIARKIGIEGKTITGNELDNIKDLHKIVEEISIYARVNPMHKLKIVDALKKKGHIVAMTGDGVNDAPALKRSDIGIAIGSGTDVSKEAADMILTDDHFSSIVDAIKEGRGIYNNIIKFVMYLLSSNTGEILIIFAAILLGLPLPLLALQLLWINLVTDGLPALALSVDPTEKDVMLQSPRKKNEVMLNKQRFFVIVFIGLIFTIGTIILYERALSVSYIYATTIAFTSIILYELLNVFNFRSETKSLFARGIFENKYILLAIFSSVLLQILVIYTPLNKIFNTVPINSYSWFVMLLTAISILVCMELLKLILRKYISNKSVSNL